MASLPVPLAPALTALTDSNLRVTLVNLARYPWARRWAWATFASTAEAP